MAHLSISQKVAVLNDRFHTTLLTKYYLLTHFKKLKIRNKAVITIKRSPNPTNKKLKQDEVGF